MDEFDFCFSEEKHLIKDGIEESLPLFDEGLEDDDQVKDDFVPLATCPAASAPIASPDYSITETVLTSPVASGGNSAQMASSSYPAFHSVQSEYQQTNVHIEPFYRYRVYSDAS